jgi:hypothetical protein
MSDTIFILLIILVAVTISAYLIRIRNLKPTLGSGTSPQSEMKSRWVRITNIAAGIALLLLVIGFFLLRSVFILWASLGVLIIALVIGYSVKQWMR